MTEPSIYARAIDVLNERGWRQGGPRRHQRNVCLEEAVEAVAGFTTETMLAIDALRDTVGTLSWCWNDASGRTQEDVILLLKYADAGELETWKALYGPEA